MKCKNSPNSAISAKIWTRADRRDRMAEQPVMRITYWLAPGRRVVLLTVFRKTRTRQAAEVERAKALRKVCEAEHDHARTSFDREVIDDG